MRLDSLALVIVAVSAVGGVVSTSSLQRAYGKHVTVFTKEEVAQCGDIRIPQMTVTPSGILLLAQCRDANTTLRTRSGQKGNLGDNMINAKVVSKFSTDAGLTWGPMRVLTPISHSHGQVVYDAQRKRVLMQYQHHPSTDPCFNSTLYQRFSEDDGQTWGPSANITSVLSRCNPAAPHNMQVGSAGSKIQTSSGRIIFLGHANGLACRWWTDDGGATYNASLPYAGDEASVAETRPGDIYMNARGLAYAWKGNRTSYWSDDDGGTFTEPTACPIKEDAGFGCSAGMVADPFPPKTDENGASTDQFRNDTAPARLFIAEPAGPDRVGLVVHCSLDGGHTWPFSTPVGDADAVAAYSALRLVKTDEHEHRILVVWEMKPNMKATHVNTSWCRPSGA